MLDVPASFITLAEERFPDADARYVLPHLIEFYRVSAAIPPVHGVIEDGQILVVSGHKYYKAALALGRSSMRVIVRSADTDQVDRFRAKPGVTLVDVDEIRRRERGEPEVDLLHLFFFAEPLTEAQKTEFDRRFVSFFRALVDRCGQGGELFHVKDLGYSEKTASASFVVRVPAEDQGWYSSYLGISKAFDREVAQILSFNGHELP
ncbi:hypothetical protein [Catellatospora sp. TT07R-123]|uniref:hypothetical protein n=1 Tax=Catellatospora sp. TT07R-123 TaxID=2733863 RepID=UPI001BB3F992|nr:hypothetical protein [Catellatospora sp. TT07R-123]